VLAGALSRAEVLYRERGQVACRGAAAGPVCNLAGAPDREAIPEGSVLVASELDLEERVTAAVKKAAAILLDRGSVTGVTARLARELRIPAIVGLGNATERLASGTDVTVDADENVVYRGRIPELLDYQRSIRWGDEEEPEYRLLRAVRRAAFPLTLAERSVEPTFEECRTFHDLVHVAHSLAGASVAGALRSRPGASIRLPDLPWCVVRVSELGGAPDDGSVREVSSVPLKLFLNGLTAGRARTGNREPSERVLDVAATGEHALCAMALPHGFDVLDATLGHGDEDNAIYCRVAPQGEADPAGARGTMALGVLRRLGFAVARTPREVSGWIRCLPSAEAAEKVRILGRLFASLSELEDSGSAGDASSVETFLREGA
jgi:pyruvate,water dikinase